MTIPVVLVTGAGGGIGRATALRFAADGAAVVCADVDGDAAARTAKEASNGAPATPVVCDVTDEGACAGAVRAAVDTHGRLDVLANIAGVGSFRKTTELSRAEWDRTLTVNLTGTFLMCREAIPALLQTAGCIVNMASIAGLRATPYNAAYCASKGGVIALTKALAVEYGGSGLRANAVCPSSVDTAFLGNFEIPVDADMALFTRTAPPLGRMATPEEIAGVVAYLASPDAAMVTGVAFVVDGGSTA